MGELAKFDPTNKTHVLAWAEFCKRGIWPVNDVDIWERTNDPMWTVVCMARLSDAYVKPFVDRERRRLGLKKGD